MSASPRTSRSWRASFARSSRRDRRRDDVMTREATSQGRRGGIFLAMFAVVALRSTTVLATMESVSGDTAVDHGGDVAHIRGRKLLALLPERYEAHPEFSCAGRNELGMLTLSLAECAAKCEEYPTCISFDFKTPTADWTSTSAYSCNLSETCTKELAATDLAHTLFVKLPKFEQLGGGWTRVRHVPSGNSWHPTTDRLAGTVVYGDSSDDSAAWSINFETAVPGYNQFLFSSSDGVFWLAATKYAVVGEYYENALRDVMSSSSNTDAHQVRWFHRSGTSEDPLITLSDVFVEAGNVFMYCGNSASGGAFTRTMTVLQDGGGADVWVRSGPPCDASSPPANGAVGTCTNSLASGSTCQPTCDPGYTVSGTSSCTAGTLTAATCVIPSPVGRYVRLNLNNYLHFSEMIVWLPGDPGTDLAAGKTVTGSAERYGGTYAGLVDGDRSTYCHTSESNSWVMVDLGEETAIGGIYIYYHGDWLSRNIGLEAEILDAQQNTVLTTAAVTEGRRGYLLDFSQGYSSPVDANQWRGLDQSYTSNDIRVPRCDASSPPANGDVGNCTSVLMHGNSCTPTCDTGYLLMGERSCVEGTYVDTAACVIPPPPPSPPPPLSPPPPPSPPHSPPPPAPLPPALRLHLVADDINTTSHADMVWRDKSTFGNDLKPHLAAPEVIEDAFNGHKALRFGFSDFFQDGVEGFSCMRLDPLSSDNLLTYGSMSHWSFPGVTVFAVIEPRPVPWGGDDDPLDFVFDFGEFPARGFGLAWHENERTLYSPTEHGGEVRRSAEPRENKKYVVAIQYTFGQDGHVRALTQFTTRLGRADLIDPTGINGAAQGFSVQGFTPATVAHEQSPFSVGCMSKENTAGGAKGKRVFRGDIAELRLYVGLLPLDEVFAIRDGLVDKYVPECERGCSLLTRRGLSQVDRYDEPAATAPTPEAYKCVADGECVSARYIRIYKTESAADKTINLLELAAWSSAFPDVNLAAGKDVTCSPACRHYGGGALLVDGSTNTDGAHSCYEGTSGTRGDLAEGACASTIPKSMEIDLGQEYLIDGVLIVNGLNASRTRVEDMKVDFMDADGNVVLTTAAIASDKNGYDGYVMDLTKEGDSLNDAGEFDAWKYIPEGDVVEAASFDWRLYRRWCAIDEFWDGAACKHCPVATTSPGGDATVCCAADEYADGSACVTCPAGSTKLTHVMCTCHADEFWNVTACATCSTGQFSLGGAETTTSCTSP